MLYLNLGIYSLIDAYIKVHLTEPKAGTARIPLYGAHWLYQPESATYVFESSITLHYCKSPQFPENTSPSLKFFSSPTYLQCIMFNLFFFIFYKLLLSSPGLRNKGCREKWYLLLDKLTFRKNWASFQALKLFVGCSPELMPSSQLYHLV